MKSLHLNDHTSRFREFAEGIHDLPMIDSNPSSGSDVLIDVSRLKNTSDHNPQKVRVVDRIDKIIAVIDKKTDELGKIAEKMFDFNSDVDEVSREFKSCSDQINAVSGQVIKIAKTYEKTEPMVARHYIVTVKEKLQNVERIASRFKRAKGGSSGIYSNNLDSDDSDSEMYRSDINHKMSEQQKMMFKHQDEQLRQTVLEREKAIKQIEQSVAEIHQQFVDVQVMIAMQGEMIDSIDSNIIKSLEYVDKGAEELEDAEKYDDKNKKLKRRITASVVIGGVIATITTFTLKTLHIV